MCRTATAKPQHVRKAKRLAKSLNNRLALIRWMGCMVAVYDCTVRAKAERRCESTRARRGTKRRGKRSGSRNARKCRRLATADPGSSPPTSLRTTRGDYLQARCELYFTRTVRAIANLDSIYVRMKRRSPKKEVLRRARRSKLVSLVDFVSRRSGSPRLVSYVRTLVALNGASVLKRTVPSFLLRPLRKRGKGWGRLGLDPEEVLDDLKDFRRYRFRVAESNSGS